MVGLEMSVEKVVEEVLKDSIFYRNSGGGLTLSGGEPLMQVEFAKEILRRCKKMGIHTAVETAGCLPWKNFTKIIPYTDLFLYDLKHLDDGEHMRTTGKGNERVIENLKRLCQEGHKVILRVPVIPEFNNSELQIRQLAELCLNLDPGIKQVELLPYHDLGIHKYDLLAKTYELKGLKIPNKEHILSLAKTLEKNIKKGGISCCAVFGTV
jgi:pyruvate formate lyase activating enzyme